MKIVVIGGTGLIGSKTVAILRQGGHEIVAASPNTGVNTITGEGLKEAVAGAQVVIDLANSPSFEDKAVLEFFETSGRNLRAAEAAAGVRHHVALSIVGTDRSDNGYFRAKVAMIVCSALARCTTSMTRCAAGSPVIPMKWTDSGLRHLDPLPSPTGLGGGKTRRARDVASILSGSAAIGSCGTSSTSTRRAAAGSDHAPVMVNLARDTHFDKQSIQRGGDDATKQGSRTGQRQRRPSRRER
jgi:hypothetical protein